MSRPQSALGGLALLVAMLSSFARAEAGIVVQTDRFSYSGVATRYDSLSDAQSNTNPGTVYNLPGRDVSLRLRSEATNLAEPGQSANAFFLVPNFAIPAFNQNFGFVQLADGDGSTLQTTDALFNGSHDAFGAFFSGSNAGSSEFARLGHDPAMNSENAIVTRGVFHQYELDAVFTGLTNFNESSSTGGVGLASNETRTVQGADGGSKVDVLGIFHGIFENNNPLNASYRGFYSVDLVFTNSSVGFSGFGLNGLDTEGCYKVSFSTFGNPAAVPEPSSLVFGGLAGLVALVIGRRRLKTVKSVI